MIIYDPSNPEHRAIRPIYLRKMAEEKLDKETAWAQAKAEVRERNLAEVRERSLKFAEYLKGLQFLKGFFEPKPEGKPAERRPWQAVGRLADPGTDWDAKDRVAYLCHRSFMAYGTCWCQKKRQLLAEGATRIERFDATETLLSKLILLGSIVLVLGAAAWLPTWYLGWFRPWHLAIPVGFLMASTLVLRRCAIDQHAFGYVQGGRSVLAFRGTTGPAQLFLTDCAALPWGIPARHFGFLRAWNKLRPQVRAWLANDTPLVVTGHSLGGAMALIAAHDLSRRVPVEAVVTFGAPRPGLWMFWWRYSWRPNGQGKRLGDVTYRYTQGTDMVSRLPPPGFYHHVGQPRHLWPDGAITPTGPPGPVLRLMAFGVGLIVLIVYAGFSLLDWLKEPYWPGWLVWLKPADGRDRWDPRHEPVFMEDYKLAPGWQSISLTFATHPLYFWVLGSIGTILSVVGPVIAVLWSLLMAAGAVLGVRQDIDEHNCEKKYMRAFREGSKAPSVWVTRPGGMVDLNAGGTLEPWENVSCEEQQSAQ